VDYFRLKRLGFSNEKVDNNFNGDHLVMAEGCIDAFVAEMKYNATIVTASFELTGLSMNDLDYFIRNNKALMTLVLFSRERVSLEHSTILSEAIGSAQLEKVDILRCCFDNDRSLEQMLEGCASVDRKLVVTCKYNSQCKAGSCFATRSSKCTKSPRDKIAQ
jgi:hypothetical protein